MPVLKTNKMSAEIIALFPSHDILLFVHSIITVRFELSSYWMYNISTLDTKVPTDPVLLLLRKRTGGSILAQLIETQTPD